jgi:hypothetical protein
MMIFFCMGCPPDRSTGYGSSRPFKLTFFAIR